ncbi:syntaxin-6 isoform X1 [Suricata suricatta]|uniref:Syntaxin 6 n=1 Tax=Suricata suricatta TaxID=37032 RepID=A0A673V5T5_SURSU|nr:syntaxin-6 isoform X1 [Suricata suricatta]
MSMEDPFFVVKGEVQKAVNTAQGLFQRWTELLQDPSTATREEIDWTTNELRNNLRSIEWDLEDLDETISIVEANPRKFNLDATELSIRKTFITSTRQVVRDMKDHMSPSSVQALAERKSRQALLGDSGGQNWSTTTTEKYAHLDRELQLANSHFIEEQQAQQQLIVGQQDEQLELVSGSIGVLKNMSQRIGGELEEQAVMLDDFSHELESTQSRLDNVMKKLAKVSHMTSGLTGELRNLPVQDLRQAGLAGKRFGSFYSAGNGQKGTSSIFEVGQGVCEWTRARPFQQGHSKKQHEMGE